MENEVIASSGLDGCIPGTAIDSFWSSERRCLDSDAIRASPPQIRTTPAPAEAHPPTHTGDGPIAIRLVPLASDTDSISPSRRSSPPPDQTKFDNRSVSRTATSKSRPPTPPFTANAVQAPKERSRTPLRLPHPGLRADVAAHSTLRLADYRPNRTQGPTGGSHSQGETRRMYDRHRNSTKHGPTSGGWKKHQTHRPRAPRREHPRLRPNNDQDHAITVAPPGQQLNPEMFFGYSRTARPYSTRC